MPAETLAFLEAISLEPAELKLCERFGDQKEHPHPSFEIILFSKGDPSRPG
jgi:hypothetical protein